MRIINVGDEFYHRLANRDERQGDGKHTAIEFRNKFLTKLANKEAWKNDEAFVTFDFSAVKKIGPSFANEAFAYFTIFAKKDEILEKILFKNITTVQMSIINVELDAGYSR